MQKKTKLSKNGHFLTLGFSKFLSTILCSKEKSRNCLCDAISIPQGHISKAFEGMSEFPIDLYLGCHRFCPFSPSIMGPPVEAKYSNLRFFSSLFVFHSRKISATTNSASSSNASTESTSTCSTRLSSAASRSVPEILIEHNKNNAEIDSKRLLGFL